MREFTSFLAPLMRAYVSFREASERWGNSYEETLSFFDKYCKKQYPDASELSQEMVDAWCRQRETETNNSCRSRIYSVVSFIQYLRKRDKTTIMDPEVPRKEPRTYIPHSFTELELENFFAACDTIPGTQKTRDKLLHQLTVPVFFRLLYSSGIRTTEARLLKRENVDLDHGVLNILYSKGHNQHYIVLHDSMLELMKLYDTSIDKQYPDRVYFFPTSDGGFYPRAWIQLTFKKMWSKYNSAHAVAYDFRHNYAIENINSWTNEGFGIHAKLLYLSKSMGHSKLEDTIYYYSLVPGLASVIGNPDR